MLSKPWSLKSLGIVSLFKIKHKSTIWNNPLMKDGILELKSTFWEKQIDRKMLRDWSPFLRNQPRGKIRYQKVKKKLVTLDTRFPHETDIDQSKSRLLLLGRHTFNKACTKLNLSKIIRVKSSYVNPKVVINLTFGVVGSNSILWIMFNITAVDVKERK